MTAVTRMI